jgi:hypothetical protein
MVLSKTKNNNWMKYMLSVGINRLVAKRYCILEQKKKLDGKGFNYYCDFLA